MTPIEALVSLERFLASEHTEMDSELAVLREAITDVARFRSLSAHAGNSLHIERNGDHACNYMTASAWIDSTREDFVDDDPAEVERMRQTNTIWRIQDYPNTPGGFNVWHGATLGAATDARMADIGLSPNYPQHK